MRINDLKEPGKNTNESPKCNNMFKKPGTKVHLVQLHLHKVQKEAKLIYVVGVRIEATLGKDNM